MTCALSERTAHPQPTTTSEEIEIRCIIGARVAIPARPVATNALVEYRELFPKWLHKKFGEGTRYLETVKLSDSERVNHAD